MYGTALKVCATVFDSKMGSGFRVGVAVRDWAAMLGLSVALAGSTDTCPCWPIVPHAIGEFNGVIERHGRDFVHDATIHSCALALVM